MEDDPRSGSRIVDRLHDRADFVFWLWEIPLAWVLSHQAGLGARGVFTALAVAYSTLAVVSAIFFKRGRWRTMKV